MRPREMKTYATHHIRIWCKRMFTAALFTTAKRQKPLKCPSTTDEWINKLWYSHIRGYSTIKKNEVLTHTRTQILKTSCSVKKARRKRSYILWFHLHEISRWSKSTDRMQTGGCQGRREWGMGSDSLMGTGFSFAVMKMSWHQIEVMVTWHWMY